MDSVAEQKFVLRRTLLAGRRALAPAQRAAWDQAIAARVLAWCAAEGVRTLGVYSAVQGEPDLSECYEKLHAAGVRLALPVVVAVDAPLLFAAWRPGDTLVKDKMGVLVPAAIEAMAGLDALLIPCLGFNAAGFRLGYGGGYYDRTLAPAPRPRTAGVAYACALADFGGQAHDIALDLIFTESGAPLSDAVNASRGTP